MTASPDGAAPVRGAPGHVPLVAMSPEQHRRLAGLKERHPGGIDVGRGPGGTVQAVVELGTYPPEHTIVEYDPDDLLDRVEEVIEADPAG